MPNSGQGSRLNATIINIHSPNDEIHSLTEDSFRRTSNASKQHVPAKLSPKAEEYKKVIQHIIGKILKRKRPPNALVHLSDICKTANVSDHFDNDDTIDLLIQLRSAMLICHQLGLSNQVLMQGERTPNASPSSSRANSPTPSPRTGSPSKSVDNASSQLPIPRNEKRSEFEVILYVLGDLILNDSRFKTANPKPSRPPYTMQTILIDIALILVQIRDDSAGLYKIGAVYLPAFESFSDGTMLGKLLSLFLDSLLPKLMKCKDEQKKQPDQKRPSKPDTIKHAHKKSLSNTNTPIINIENSDTGNNNNSLKMSHLTIDTRPYPGDSYGSPYSPAEQSVHSSIQNLNIDSYHAYALFTPLLFFMIQYLDPYLSAQTSKTPQDNLNYTLTQQANSIHNFHRALSYMMSYKPDLYLDILNVISHSTAEVKFRACQILFHYYFDSVGHVMVADPLPPLGTQEEVEILDHHREQQELEEQRQENNQFGRYDRQGTPIGAEIIDEDGYEDHHVWYPHLFDASHRDIPADSNSGGTSMLVHDDMQNTYCKECLKPVEGFGLRCFQCKSCVHYNCSSTATDLKDQGILFYVKASGIQKVVTPQFCIISPQPRFRDMVNRGILGWTAKSNSPRIGLRGHTFELVNLYTLMICACCGMPLWGISQQGYRCGECNRFVHPHCLAEAEEKSGFYHQKKSSDTFQCVPYQALKESDLQISQQNLTKHFLEFYGDMIPNNLESLENKSTEEVGTILNVLLLQDHILHCGVAAGCVLITHEDNPLQAIEDTTSSHSSSNICSDHPSHCASLTSAIKICNDYLSSGKARSSNIYHDFYGHSPIVEKFLLSKEEYLGHLSAMIKCLMTVFPNAGLSPAQPPSDKRRSAGDSRGFLQVSRSPFTSNWEDDDDEFGDDHIPNECLDRSIILSWVMTNLNFKSQKAAEMLLQHMRDLGLFERFDGSPILFPNMTFRQQQLQAEQEKAIQCIFPVPYAIDASPNVESLIDSIVACLRDVDLSINECGFLLLVKRCWPDPFMSEYTKERLIQAIIGWTFDEDENLLALYSEFTSSGKTRSPHNKQQNKWAQAVLLSRMKGGSQYVSDRKRQSAFFQNNTAGVSSGASTMYVTTRSALRDRYVVRWMAAIHDMGSKSYTDILFNAIEDIIDNKREDCIIPNWGENYDMKRIIVQKYELFVSYIVKLKTNGLTFSSLDPILQRWLEQSHYEFNNFGILKDKDPVDIRHLAKLCSSRPPAAAIAAPSSAPFDTANPIDIIVSQFVAGDSFSIDRGMRWLNVLVHSGAGIPSGSLAHIARLIGKSHAPLDITAEFVKAVWFQAMHISSIPTPRAVVLDVIGYLNEIALETLRASNESQALSDESLSSAQTFIKYSAALTCYAYSCPVNNISELGIVPHIGDHTTNNQNQPRRAANQTETSSTLMQADEKIPLIKCLLIYLRFDQLNVREDIIKAFYALMHSAQGISNKDEFILKCMPQLISSVWELLTPTYDYLSDINLSLLMKLISVDVRYFQACVFKIFEDTNWEVRYQGLDNLYGLFTKMDAAFQTEWLKLLSHLGPVFSYFIGCLWDKEEYVRSKAHALIRTFGTLHLRSAFRCWEAYFLTATDRQKMSLVSLMIQLNALFPDWQVLQWESLLEALEMKTSFDVLDEYMRPHLPEQQKNDADVSGSDSAQRQDQQSAESENVKVLMLTLALQLLSNHLSIEPSQILRLKFVLVQQMGFQNCQLFNDGGEITIEFGQLKYNPKDPARVAVMISCIRGLKKIMDSFAPLPAEKVATMASDSLEQNRMNLSANSSPGVHFIDVVLKMMNSGIDLTKIGHLVLKAWLEIILIVIYKHNILDREYEQSIVTCMKQIIDLLTEEISEENKLLILETLKCLLRRSDHLTAMVLSRQILALGKLMTKLGVRNSEPVYLKAKQFLKSAFLRFAVAGLFVLMFKNQAVSDTNSSDVDLFFVLRTVIDQDDVIPDEDMNGEIIYLRDQPLRDVIDKLMKQQMERKAFSTVLYNTSRYVETVHTHPYSETILNDYASFMSALAKHTADWRRSDWNINPVFIMSAILLKEHPYHHSILLPPLQTLFKQGLSNCNVQPEAVVKLMASYSTIIVIPGTQPNNIFVDILIDEIKNAFSPSAKPNKDTTLVLLQLVLWDIKPIGQEWYLEIEEPIFGKSKYGKNRVSYFENKLLTLLPYFVSYLKRAPNTQQFTRKDFKVYSCTAQLITSMCARDPKLMVIIFGYLKLEETVECLRFLTWFILTLLGENADDLLNSMLEYEVVLTELLVKSFNTIEIDFSTPDLNFSYSLQSERLLLSFLLLKGYVLLKLRTGSMNKDIAMNPYLLNAFSFWMTLWPALRRLIDLIDPSTLFVTGNVGLSVWNMFLSLLQFLFASRSEVVMINAYEWNDLLDGLLRKIKENEAHYEQESSGVEFLMSLETFRKQVEKLKEMFIVPPIEVPSTIMVDHLTLELRDIMRLQAEAFTLQGNNRTLYQTMSPAFN